MMKDVIVPTELAKEYRNYHFSYVMCEMLKLDEAVEIQIYNSYWPEWYLQEEEMLRAVFDPSCTQFEHFGSTAVPGLDAKPIIDILIGLPNIPPAPSQVEQLKSLGYDYLGEAGIPGRHYFRKRNEKSYNLAIVQLGSPLWEDNLLIRDYLRNHPKVAKEYGELKRELIQRGFCHLLSYSDQKKTWIQKLVARAKEGRIKRPT
jgi:GrpB-like predicted nucleotidyltransferase (UPF0157 family)